MVALPAQTDLFSGPEAGSPLKREFAGLTLGQDISEVREVLLESRYFLYPNSESEIVLPNRVESILEVEGSGFVSKLLLQFEDEKISAITVLLDVRWTSYQELFDRLRGSYGNPVFLSPHRCLWEDEQTVLLLEKNLRYKLMNRIRSGEAEEAEESSLMEKNRQAFLDEFTP